MIILGAQHGLLNLPSELLSTAVATNLTVSILIRQELVINLLFIIFGKCPQWFPLRIRRLAAKIYHLGGVHSGAGIAATIWFGIYNVSVFRISEEVMSNNLKSWILGITMLQDVLLIGILAMSFPKCRQWNHNLFEQTHRFAGWTAVGLFWAVFFLLTVARHQQSGQPVMKLVCTAPAFWLLFTSTISLILPWLRLRRVPLQAEPLSDHAVRLHFTYANTPLCAAPRITDNPLKEWHAFAGIPEEDGVRLLGDCVESWRLDNEDDHPPTKPSVGARHPHSRRVTHPRQSSNASSLSLQDPGLAHVLHCFRLRTLTVESSGRLRIL